jgi:hypothetical protein
VGRRFFAGMTSWHSSKNKKIPHLSLSGKTQGRKIFRVTTLLYSRLAAKASTGAKLHRGDITVAPPVKPTAIFSPQLTE